MKGTVEKFFEEKGFGFIKTVSGSYFFHINTALDAGLSKADFIRGAKFDVEIGEGRKGPAVIKFNTSIQAITKKQHKPKAATKHKTLVINSCENYYLLLNKPYYHKTRASLYDKEEGKYKFKLEKRKNELENFNFPSISFEKIDNRHKENIKNAFYDSDTSICLKPDWRLAVGLGGASVYETSITLHHVYGIPYIPASSIKGIVRSWIITEFFGSVNIPENETKFPLINAEFRAFQNENFCKIFGCPSSYDKVLFSNGEPLKNEKGKYLTKKEEVVLVNKKKQGQEYRGKIYFFDAFPTEKRNLKISLDIMNVHYEDYYKAPKNPDGTYSKGTVPPPADWSNPNIVNFLTIKGATFRFNIAAKDDSLNTLKIADKTISEWLKEALTEHGIGAKTAVGYGYLQEQ